LVWSVGVFGIWCGLQRSSFGVAGLDATVRFHAAPAVLSTFVVLQLLVYASCRCRSPAVDAYGAQRLILVGGLTMAAGQLLLAVAPGSRRLSWPHPWSVAGTLSLHQRAAGDERLVPAPAGAGDDPLTGLIGQFGQVLSGSRWSPCGTGLAGRRVRVDGRPRRAGPGAVLAVIRDRRPRGGADVRGPAAPDVAQPARRPG